MGEGDHVLRRVGGGAEAKFDALQRIGLGQARRCARHEGKGVLELAGEVAVAHHPVQGAAVAAPVQVGAHVLADARDRNRLGVARQLDAAAGLRQRRHVGIEQFGEGNPAAVGAECGEVDVLEVEHFARLLAVQAHRHQLLLQAAVAGEVEHARAVGAELRFDALLGHAPRRAVGQLLHVDALLAAVELAGERTAGLLGPGDAAAVARVGRAVVEARRGADDAVAAACQLAFVDCALRRVRPGGIEQARAVGAETRLVFEHCFVAAQARGCATGQGLGPQVAQGMEHQGLAVGAGGHVTDHLRREAAAVEVLLEAQRRGDGLAHLGAEGNLRRRAAGDIHAPQLALRPDHQALRVGGPGEVGVGAEDRPGLLHIVRQAVPQRAHGAAGEVEHLQHALVAHALDEGQRRAVGRGLRTHGAARGVDDGLHLARLAVQALDRVDRGMRVLVVLEVRPSAHVLGEIHPAAVRAHCRLAEILLVVLLLGELQAVAAADVVQPQLARAERTFGGVVLASDQVLAIGRPGRIVEQAEILVAHLRRAAAVAADAPQVIAAAAVGGVGEPLPVGREARLHVPGRARGQAPGVAAFDRQEVDVAEQREGDGLAVAAYVQVEPGALVDREAHGLGGPVRGVDVPLRRIFPVGLVRRNSGQGEGKAQRKRKRSARHRSIPQWKAPMLGDDRSWRTGRKSCVVQGGGPGARHPVAAPPAELRPRPRRAAATPGRPRG